jgi:hypothetical protein
MKMPGAQPSRNANIMSGMLNPTDMDVMGVAS